MNNQLQQRQRETVSTLVKKDSVKSRFTEVLGHRAPQFCSSIIAISQQRHLANCDPNSVLASAMVAATLNLPVNQTLGLAYIVPYAGKAQFQIGYKGLVQLAIRSGQYKHLNTFAVYEGQIIKTSKKTGQVEFNDDVEDSGDPIGYGAFLETVNGYQHTVYWKTSEIIDHAERFSQAYRAKKKDSPWLTDFDSMAKKTVLKSLLTHWGPMSIDIETAVSRDMSTQDSIDSTPRFDDNLTVDEIPMGKIGEGKEGGSAEEQPSADRQPGFEGEAQKPKRKRRTKAEMEQARLAEQPAEPAAPEQPAAPETESGNEPENVEVLPTAQSVTTEQEQLEKVLTDNGFAMSDFNYFMNIQQDYDVAKNGFPNQFARAILKNPAPLLAELETLRSGQ